MLGAAKGAGFIDSLSVTEPMHKTSRKQMDGLERDRMEVGSTQGSDTDMSHPRESPTLGLRSERNILCEELWRLSMHSRQKDSLSVREEDISQESGFAASGRQTKWRISPLRPA